MNDIPTPSSHPCQENSSFGAFVEKVDSWGLHEFRASSRTTPSATRKPDERVFRGARAGHYGGLKRWWKSAGKDIETTFAAKIQQLWRCHDEGMSSREIAKSVGWRSHASVLYHLKRGRPALEPSRWSMPSEESPRKAELEKPDSSNLLQRGREKEKFGAIPKAERAGETVAEMVDAGLAPERTIQELLSNFRKEDQRQEAFGLWLAGETQEMIADAVGISRKEFEPVLREFADLQKCAKPLQTAALFADDFTPPLYNVWKQQDRSAGRFTESRAYKSALEANLRNNKARIDRWSMAG